MSGVVTRFNATQHVQCLRPRPDNPVMIEAVEVVSGRAEESHRGCEVQDMKELVSGDV